MYFPRSDSANVKDTVVVPNPEPSHTRIGFGFAVIVAAAFGFLGDRLAGFAPALAITWEASSSPRSTSKKTVSSEGSFSARVTASGLLTNSTWVAGEPNK